MPLLSNKPLVVTVLALAGVACFVAVSVHLHPTNASAATATRDGAASISQPLPSPQASKPAGACVAPVSSEIPSEALTEVQNRARELADHKRFAEALPEFRNIAAVDPGYPGVNLDLSVSLLQLKHTGDAKAAIDSQLAVSDCLSRLPAPALKAYCKAEMPHSSVDTCRDQLKSIRQTAYFQAALVQMELGHTVNGEPPARAAEVGLAPAPLPRARAPRTVAAAPPAHRPMAPRVSRSSESSADRALERGVGTDADLGYSKN
jgi:hypothetical protein